MQTAVDEAGGGKGKWAESYCAVRIHAEHLSNRSVHASPIQLQDYQVSLTSSDIPANILARHADPVKQQELIRSELTCIFLRAAYNACHLALYSTP